MRRLLFADTTVLINFQICGRMDLLSAIEQGSGRWCATVEGECTLQERRDEIENIQGLHDQAAEVLGDCFVPSDDEITKSFRLRGLMAKDGEHPLKHLGEAETIVIIEERWINATIVSDDADVPQRTATKVATTWDLLAAGVRTGRASIDDVRLFRSRLLSCGRVHAEYVKRPEDFEAWLRSLAPRPAPIPQPEP